MILCKDLESQMCSYRQGEDGLSHCGENGSYFSHYPGLATNTHAFWYLKEKTQIVKKINFDLTSNFQRSDKMSTKNATQIQTYLTNIAGLVSAKSESL